MMIRQRGFQPMLEGRPSDELERLPVPAVVHLPLTSRRLQFTALKVRDGDWVQPGQAVAVDPERHDVPLLASIAGTVRLNSEADCVTIESADGAPPRAGSAASPPPAAADTVIGKLVQGGAWAFFADAHSGDIPDPEMVPRAVIVTGGANDLFVARPDVVLRERPTAFARGLKLLQGLAGKAPVHLALPPCDRGGSAAAGTVLTDLAGVQPLPLSERYPDGHPALLARQLKLPAEVGHPVWALSVEGVLALDTVLTEQRPVTLKISTLGGPAAASPRHIEAAVGYPLAALTGTGPGAATDAVVVVDGGAMTGALLPASQLGLGPECNGLTLLHAPRQREFLGWLRPRPDRRSFSRCFASTFFSRPGAPAAALLGGERRACIACGYCAEVCPVSLLPQLLHRYLYAKEFDAAATAGLELCLGCGLCAYVCPSKIELRQQFAEAVQHLRSERAEAAAHAARAT